MSFCPNCGRYTYGNQYCYNCYQYNIEKNIAERNLTMSSNNTCLKCNKLIDGIGYCIDCYKNHIVKSPETIVEEYYLNNLFTQQRFLQKEYFDKIKTERKCICCSKEAKIGSYYCNEHYNIFFEEQTLNNFFDKPQKNYKKTKYIKTETENRICQICGACSYNMPFCYSCYISFVKNEEYNSLSQYENDKIYTCKSGIRVRSLSEREISNFLTENNIPHVYEKELKYKFTNYYYDKEFIKTLHPDFYIPGPIKFKDRIIKNVYIEFWGFDENDQNIKYTNAKLFKIKNYQEMGITLINTDKNDLNNVEESLTYKLLNYENNKINY